ncbi:MAG: hypothetical protein JWQ49_3220 [Edaphobacter sp.]|nr:hypothetical protein [Edaphobacter sp.]
MILLQVRRRNAGDRSRPISRRARWKRRSPSRPGGSIETFIEDQFNEEKIKLEIVAYFSVARYDHQPTIVYHAFHHKLTTKTPHSAVPILQNPLQKHHSTMPGKKERSL